MARHVSDEILMRFADEEVSGTEMLEAEIHIDECAACRDKLKLVNSENRFYEDAFADAGLSEGIAEAVRKRIVTERQTRFTPRTKYGLAAASIIAVICGYAVLSGPIEDLFRDLMGLETYSLRVPEGYQHEMRTEIPLVDPKALVAEPLEEDIGKLRYTDRRTTPEESKTPVPATSQISLPEAAQRGEQRPEALSIAPASPIPSPADPTTFAPTILNEVSTEARVRSKADQSTVIPHTGLPPSYYSPRMGAGINQLRQEEVRPAKAKSIAGKLNKMGFDRGIRAMEQGMTSNAPLVYDVQAGYSDLVPLSNFNTEQYDEIVENEFLAVTNNPVSTFSIDVDRASYSNIRRYLTSNQMPPKSAVRIEEMINYFRYDYPQPEADIPFSINTEIGKCPWNADHLLLHVGLQGREIAIENLPPGNIVFLIDVSGSMKSANKLDLLKSSFRLLVERLREIDRVAIVVYAGSSGLVLPSTPGSRKATILEAIDRLEAGGSTAGAAGIQLAYEVAEQNFQVGANNRVILATDGDFNVGVSSDGELVELIEKKRETGVYLTVLGFGTGNLKDSRMEKLADKGNGNYAYIDSIREGQKVFVHEMAGTLVTIAKDVKIQIEFNPANVKAYRLIGYENRKLAREDFDDDRKDAGELGSGHTVTALYEIIPSASKETVRGVQPLKYREEGTSAETKYPDEMLTLKLRYKNPHEDKSKLLSRTVSRSEITDETSNNLDFAAAVAEFGLLLRDSRFKGTATYDHALRQARSSKGADLEGYRAELISLVESAKLLN